MGTLVYDEILIINKCGLNINVKKKIEDRALSEFRNTIQDLKEVNENEEKEEKNVELAGMDYIVIY